MWRRLVWLLPLLAAVSADAQDVGFSRPGPYAGVGGTIGLNTFESDLEKAARPVDIEVEVEHTAGVEARLGYRLHPRVALEIEAQWLERFEGEISGFSGFDVEAWVFTGNIKAYLFTGRLQPFALLGQGAMTHRSRWWVPSLLAPSRSGRQTDFTLRLGGGIDVYATAHILASVAVDYVLPFAEEGDLDFVSIAVGLGYRY